MRMPKLPPVADLLTTAQVAALKGVHVTTVNRWVKAGKLPVAVKVPGKTGANLYHREAVDALDAKAEAAA